MAVTASIVSRDVRNLTVDHTPAPYDPARTYAQHDMAEAGGIKYVSLQAANAGNAPAASPAWWEPESTFYASQVIGINISFTGGATVASPPYHHFQIRERHPGGIPDAATSSATLAALYHADMDAVWGVAAMDKLENAVETIARPAPGF